MIEAAILAVIAAAVAAYIAWPRRSDLLAPTRPEAEDLRDEREDLLQELEEIDDDAAAGLMTADDRLAARRAIGPRLRRVTDALRDLGESVEHR